jgi:hypothetical protein
LEDPARRSADELRRRNWLAIAISTVVMMFSYFPYAAAFTVAEGETQQIDPALVGVGLVVAPFVFIALGFVSRNPKAPKRILQSMGLLLLLGLAVGLLSPVLGATAGFATGATLCLNPLNVSRPYKWRWWATVLATVYTLLLLVVATPAGVFTGGLVPLLLIGFADEYASWDHTRKASAAL